MRAMPKMQVVVPADYNQAYRAVIDSYDREGPMYMRFGRPATPIVYDEIPESMGKGLDVLREGKDISIFACGHMVWRALEAAKTLEREDGIEAEVVNVAIIKPLASRLCPRLARKDGRRRHRRGASQKGGLGDAIRQVAAEQHPVPVFALGMKDEFGVSGTAEACMEHFGLTANGIADVAREAMVKKPLVLAPAHRAPLESRFHARELAREEPSGGPSRASRVRSAPSSFASSRRVVATSRCRSPAARRGDAAFSDDDLHLSLYVHIRAGLQGVRRVRPGEFEWHPAVLGLRAALEDRVLRERPLCGCPPAPMSLRATSDPPVRARHRVRWRRFRSPPGHRRHRPISSGSSLIHRSAYQLKEADPHSWVIPRLAGQAQDRAASRCSSTSTGSGNADRAHSRLFAQAMDALGLDFVLRRVSGPDPRLTPSPR